MRRFLRSLVLWVFGGALYFLMEVSWKLARGHPNEISWTMLVLAAVVSIPLDQVNERLPWDMPLWLQAVLGGLGITAAELVTGLVLNVRLGLGVWDYTDMPLNLWGQICLPYSLLWVLLAGVGIVLFDWLRYWLYGERRPEYILLRK
ncbi:MAG: putative ABC transporter permease [Intestinimonas sp.]|jgi:hypothetical protein|nr:putative ABC transporter permease [Intestinimonas sp.]